MPTARTILHVDLDAFYASVEQRDDPSLRGRPVIVGGAAPRGVVAAASYEARRFGVRSAMPTVRALAQCPKAVLIRPRMAHYGAVSEAFFAILGDFSPLIEGLSLDEAFLDGTGAERLLGDGRAIGEQIKARVRQEISLVASVGVAPCKFVAKVASDLGKPDGLLVVAPDEVVSFLAPLPIGRLWGVGEVTDKSLAELGLRTIGDLTHIGEDYLIARLGRDRAQHLLRLSRGEDDRPVQPDRAPVSAGSEETYDRDLHDRDALRPHLLAQSDQACARLRHLGLRARTVTVKVKYGDHQLVTRRTTLGHATADEHLIGEVAIKLLAEVPLIERRGVRLTGVSLSGFEGKDQGGQLLLDEARVERGEHLGDALDKIREKFGGAAVRRAVHIRAPGGKKDDDQS